MIKNWGKGTGRSRKREISHGWVMGDDLSSAISTVLGCDLNGVISEVRLSERREEKGENSPTRRGKWRHCSSKCGWTSYRCRHMGWSSVSFSLVRGVELKCLASRTMWSVWGVKNFGNVLKVKWILQLFYGSEGFILRSTQMFFVWPNFPCTTKHTGECKIFSQIHFQLKQTQP